MKKEHQNKQNNVSLEATQQVPSKSRFIMTSFSKYVAKFAVWLLSIIIWLGFVEILVNTVYSYILNLASETSKNPIGQLIVTAIIASSLCTGFVIMLNPKRIHKAFIWLGTFRSRKAAKNKNNVD